MQPVMISCFDKSTLMAQPWAEAGYRCYCIDIQHPRGETREGNIIKVGADMHHWIPPRGDIAFAAFFPPCTDLAVSGARWFKEKGLHRLSDAIALFARCIDMAETLDCPWMIENPVSTISSYWRKPDHTFHPWQYGDPYTKKTCLWVGNGFVMPETTPVFPTEGSKMHKLPPSEDRADQRSLTPAGFARAVFESNRWKNGGSYGKERTDRNHPLRNSDHDLTGSLVQDGFRRKRNINRFWRRSSCEQTLKIHLNKV